MKISSNFHKSKMGIAKTPPKIKFFFGSSEMKRIWWNSLAYRFHNASVINSEELIRSGDHVNSVRLALGAFAVKKLVYRLIDRLLLKDHLHDLKKGLAKQW